MTPFLLLEAVGEINEQYVEEAERYRRKRALSRPLRWVSAAACLAAFYAPALPSCHRLYIILEGSQRCEHKKGTRRQNENRNGRIGIRHQLQAKQGS